LLASLRIALFVVVLVVVVVVVVVVVLVLVFLLFVVVMVAVVAMVIVFLLTVVVVVALFWMLRAPGCQCARSAKCCAPRASRDMKMQDAPRAVFPKEANGRMLQQLGRDLLGDSLF